MLQIEKYIADWPDIEFPNFIAWLEESEKQWSGREALRYRRGNERNFTVWTYRHLAEEARRIARGLLDLGLEKGDRVALWSENRPEWCAIWLGSVIAGLVIVPIDFLLHDHECKNIIDFAEPKVVFLPSRKKTLADMFADTAFRPKRFVLIDDDYLLFGQGAENHRLPKSCDILPDDPASLIFTSGTTGLAKGVMLSHHGIIANANASILALPIYKDDVFMTILPLHHTYPTTCSFISPLSVGASCTIVEKLVGKKIIADVKDSGGTIMIAVPLLYDKVKAAIAQGFNALPAPLRTLLSRLQCLSLRFAQRGNRNFGKRLFFGLRKHIGLSSVRLMVAGGGPLNGETADFFDSLGFYIVQGYGMSENGPLITTNTMKYKNNKSAGLAVKYTTIKIVDQNEEGVGEICVTSPSLMLGYFKNPETTEQMFTSDGYLKTGDLGYRDQDGFLFITGRKKNLIVTMGGKNIYPEEIEVQFEQSRIVAEILVLGRKSEEHGGEEVFAAIVPGYEYIAETFPEIAGQREAMRALVKKEVEQVNRGLESYKKISDFILRDEPFEKTSSQKIKRYLYREYEMTTGNGD
jgi:long-chain acyl-CoA synthetase